MSTLTFELKQAVRSLGRTPGFTALAAGVLALGLGAATSLFGLLDRLALRPLSYPEPSRLVAVWRAVEGEFREGQLLGPDFEDVERSSSFEALGMGCPSSPVLERPDGPVILAGARVSRDFFTTLRVVPLLGRGTFTREEERFGGPPAAILSFEAWRRYFGADPRVVGSAVPLDGKATLVAGVLPRGFTAPTMRLGGTEVFVPLALTPAEREERGANFEAFGRLAPGVTRARAEHELVALASGLGWGRVTLRLAPLAEGLSLPYLSILVTLSTAVALLVLVACANVASLLLARRSTRTTELAIRSALGADPRALVRQVLVESALLGLLGLALGVALSFGFSKVLSVFVGLASTPPLNLLVLSLSALAALLAALLAGAIPALQAARFDPGPALKEGAARVTRVAFRTGLVAGEVALATCLLVGAALLGRSLMAQLEADPGFDTKDRLVASVAIPPALFPSPESRLAFARDLEERLKALPGVEAAGLVLPVPLVNAGGWGTVHDPASGRTVNAFRHWVSPGAPAALGLRLLSGRPLLPGETSSCLVSRPLAEALWPGKDPIGQLLEGTHTVVGLVAGTKEHNLVQAPRAQFFIPLDPDLPFVNILIRTSSDPSATAGAVRRVLREISPRLAASGLETLDAAVRKNASYAGRMAGLLGAFALAALLLAAAGTYGVLRTLTLQRTREIGVRMALGARAPQVVVHVLGQGLRMAGLGALLGLGGGVALSGFLRSQIYGVVGLDPASFLAALALALLAATLACLPPAFRAARVDPAAALRSE